MQAPQPSAAERRANAAFEAVLWALSRPGLPRDLPQPGEAGLIEALLDRECAAFTADPALEAPIRQTGARLAPLAEADHVFLGESARPEDLAGARRGSDLYPDEGATLILRAAIGRGTALRLSGPGIEGALEIALDLPPALWEARARAIRYPMGLDLIILDGARLLGLPRSTKLELV